MLFMHISTNSFSRRFLEISRSPSSSYTKTSQPFSSLSFLPSFRTTSSRFVCKLSDSGSIFRAIYFSCTFLVSVSWLVLPRNAVSIGASGAVFGIFAIIVLVKMTRDWRKIIELLIFGQFVIEKVMEAAQASAAISGTLRGDYPMQSVNHIAHLSRALVGVVLVWLVSRIPSPQR